MTDPDHLHLSAEAVQVRARMLENLKVGAQYVVSRAVFEDDKASAYVDNQLARRLTSYVLADHIADDTYTKATTFAAPRSTWQMFKWTHEASWWLGWLVRRRPVEFAHEQRTLTIHVKRYLTYPDAAIRTPDLGPFRILEQVSPSWGKP